MDLTKNHPEHELRQFQPILWRSKILLPKFQVVLFRIRLFPTLTSKIKRLESGVQTLDVERIPGIQPILCARLRAKYRALLSALRRAKYRALLSALRRA